jgi:hypothetical protein
LGVEAAIRGRHHVANRFRLEFDIGRRQQGKVTILDDYFDTRACLLAKLAPFEVTVFNDHVSRSTCSPSA